MPTSHAALLLVLMTTLGDVAGADDLMPTHQAVSYGDGREVMDLYLAPSQEHTPFYLFGHQKGASLHNVPRKAIRECHAAGISFISVEANDVDGVVGYELTTPLPWFKAIDYLLENADRYNLDPKNLFIGGRSLGSIGSFPTAMTRWKQVRGIYSVQALPNRGEQAAALVHRNGPPCRLVFKTAAGSNNHDPVNGIQVRNAYAELGIGERFVMQSKVPPGQWYDGLVAFIQEHEKNPPSSNSAAP